jgi:predicted DNA-binding transcriptional regulator YafY
MVGYQEICRAIKERRVISFYYSQTMRTVEPHLVGYDGDGDLTLSAWQLSGTGQGWRDFHVSKLTGLSITDRIFSGARSGYNAWDKTIDRVVCRL